MPDELTVNEAAKLRLIDAGVVRLGPAEATAHRLVREGLAQLAPDTEHDTHPRLALTSEGRRLLAWWDAEGGSAGRERRRRERYNAQRREAYRRRIG